MLSVYSQRECELRLFRSEIPGGEQARAQLPYIFANVADTVFANLAERRTSLAGALVAAPVRAGKYNPKKS
jgi:hypothetical protein